MRQRTINIVMMVLAILALGLAVRAQGNVVTLQPGQSLEVICVQPTATATETVTPEPTSTWTPEPTATWTLEPTVTATLEPTATWTPEPTPTWTPDPTSTATPEPTATPAQPSALPLCGLFYTQAADALVVDQVDATIAHLIVRPAQGAASWRQQIGALFDGGAMVILEMYPRPWSWNGSEWVFDQYADPFLDLAAELRGTGQVLAVFGPPDEPYAHNYTTEQLQALYQALKARAPNVPVYSTFGSLHYWEGRDPARVIAPGVVDYASPHYYPFDSSGYRRETYIAELEAEIEILDRLAPDTHLIWLVQAFALPTHTRQLRMPTYDELLDASNLAIERGVSILYYTYNRVASSYTDYLALHPELLGAVCPGGGEPTPAPPATATPTVEPTATATSTPVPTNTPQPAVGYDDIFFCHKSIGDSILTSMATPHVDGFTLGYGTNAAWFAANDGILHTMAFGNLYDPLSKVQGFDGHVRAGIGAAADAAMMKFCVSDTQKWSGLAAAQIWAAYREMMVDLEIDYPDLTLIWWTMPVGSTSAWDLAEHAAYNALVRNYCTANGCLLFDIAALQSDGGTCTVGGYEAMCPAYAATDGAHLSPAGQERVADALGALLRGE